MIEYIILGLVQGFTEFLPVSSSGHLALLQYFFGVTKDVVELDIVLHLGTMVALIVFFFRDILSIAHNIRLTALLFLTTCVTGAVAIAGKDFFESLFISSGYLAAGFIITGLILFVLRWFMQGKRKEITVLDAFIMGLAQAIAIVPSISRSGFTVASLLLRGIEKEMSFRFSFIAAIPAILGAALLEIKEINNVRATNLFGLTVGFVCSLAAGLVSLWLLKGFIHKAKLHYFGYYCIILGIVTLFLVR